MHLKNNLRTSLLFSLGSFLLQNSLEAQKKDTTVQNHLRQIRSLYADDVYTGKRYVTTYMFDSIVTETQNKISGVLIKQGKVVGTTASVEDKSVTINHSFAALANGRLSLQLTAGGTADDNFVDIFSEGKYKRTITSGLNFNIFPRYNSGGYFVSEKRKLWSLLYLQDSCYKARRAYAISKKDSLFTLLQTIYNRCSVYLCREKNVALSSQRRVTDSLIINCDSCSLKELVSYFDILNQLSGYFPDHFDSNSCSDNADFLDSLAEHRLEWAADLSDQDNLTVLDSLQRAAPWTRFRYNWLSGSLKLNQKNHPLLDPMANVNLYTRDFHDVFFSASVSYNFMFSDLLKKVIHYVSPTLNFDDERGFVDDSLLNLQVQHPLTVNSDTLYAVKSTSFYRQKANRKNNFGLEVPYVFYYPKTGFGLDLAVGTKFSNKLDNLYARFGFYIPITVDKDNTVTIEPIVRLNKLNKSSLSFLKDQLSFGFNISVTIPKFLTQ